MLHSVGRTLLSAGFDLDFCLCSKTTRSKIKFKGGGQECPPHTGQYGRVFSSKQLHLQEVTVDSRCENYIMTKVRKEAWIRAVFDDESGTPGDCREWDNPEEDHQLYGDFERKAGSGYGWKPWHRRCGCAGIGWGWCGRRRKFSGSCRGRRKGLRRDPGIGPALARNSGRCFAIRPSERNGRADSAGTWTSEYSC